MLREVEGLKQYETAKRIRPRSPRALRRFLDDGTLELDTNPVENQIRPNALTRRRAYGRPDPDAQAEFSGGGGI